MSDHYLGSLCPECGWNVRVDEDGLCISCGATAVGRYTDEAIRFKIRAEQAEAERDYQYKMRCAAEHQRDDAEEKNIDMRKTHDALRELCRQHGTPLDQQSSAGEDIVLWADALIRELEARVQELERERDELVEAWLTVCHEGNVPQYENVESADAGGILHGVHQLASMWSAEKTLREALKESNILLINQNDALRVERDRAIAERDDLLIKVPCRKCEGSGWLEGDHSEAPCPRCNPGGERRKVIDE